MMLQPLGLFVLAAAGVSAIPAPSIVSNSAQSISIGKTTHFGTGCPQTTTDFSVTADGNNIISHFPSFSVNPSSATDATMFCGIAINVNCSPGQQFAVVATSYHDTLNIPNGGTGSHIMTYYFSNNAANTVETRHDFNGAIRGGVQATDVVPANERVWSACGYAGTLVINNRGAVSGGGSTSTFNDGNAVTTLEWRNC